MKVLKAGALYFMAVCGAGFVTGTVRTLWAVPRFGARTAELMEMPLMLAVIIISARIIIRRLAVPPTPSSRLGTGLIALSLLLTVEFTFVLRLRGLSIGEYFTDLDPVSETVYYLMLIVFAAMPLILSRIQKRSI